MRQIRTVFYDLSRFLYGCRIYLRRKTRKAIVTTKKRPTFAVSKQKKNTRNEDNEVFGKHDVQEHLYRRSSCIRNDNRFHRM